MSQKPSDGLHNRCKGSHMHLERCLAEARLIVREAAEPASPGDSVKSAIRRAARRLGLTAARAHGHWYGRVRWVPAHEMDALRARRHELALEELRRSDERAALLRARLGTDAHQVVGRACVGAAGQMGTGST